MAFFPKLRKQAFFKRFCFVTSKRQALLLLTRVAMNTAKLLNFILQGSLGGLGDVISCIWNQRDVLRSWDRILPNTDMSIMNTLKDIDSCRGLLEILIDV